MPGLALAGIAPSIGKGGDVFGEPYKERDQKQAHSKGHGPARLIRPKPNHAREVKQSGDKKQPPSHVIGKVMGEEIDIDGQRHKALQPERRKAVKLEMK